jgi:hypothetical protein
MSGPSPAELEDLGATLLDGYLVGSADRGEPVVSSSFSEPIYLRAVQLSTLLQSLNCACLSPSDADALLREVGRVLESMPAAAQPAPTVGPGALTSEAIVLSRMPCSPFSAGTRAISELPSAKSWVYRQTLAFRFSQN